MNQWNTLCNYLKINLLHYHNETLTLEHHLLPPSLNARLGKHHKLGDYHTVMNKLKIEAIKRLIAIAIYEHEKEEHHASVDFQFDKLIKSNNVYDNTHVFLDKAKEECYEILLTPTPI